MNRTPTLTLTITLALLLCACQTNSQSPNATSSPNASPSTAQAETSISQPILDSLLSDEAFRADLKSKLKLTDEQIAALKQVSADEAAKLDKPNTEQQTTIDDASRKRLLEAIRGAIGSDNSEQFIALARERWSKGSDQDKATKEPELAALKGPNAVPKDTRIIVNIPAFRMDVFREGTLLKSYKIGIGYQQFPLPTGFRKAETIIFNPTWTQPNESWASNPGAVTPAGAAGNPLGPIKVPIGGANLIHGGKALAKIGTFASHGCVGLTNDEVKDFTKVLADATTTELTEETMAAYLKKKTRTQVVKLSKVVPVELRYETIVIQDGQLHVYRDVYNKNTNTEENLRAVFEANGVSFDSLTEEEKTKALDALRPKKIATPKPTPMPTNLNAADRKALAAEKRAEAERQRNMRNQKEIVLDLASLSGKGYPPPKDLHTGVGSIASDAGAPALKPKPRRNPTPGPQSTPAVGQPPRNISGPSQ